MRVVRPPGLYDAATLSKVLTVHVSNFPAQLIHLQSVWVWRPQKRTGSIFLSSRQMSVGLIFGREFLAACSMWIQRSRLIQFVLTAAAYSCICGCPTIPGLHFFHSFSSSDCFGRETSAMLRDGVVGWERENGKVNCNIHVEHLFLPLWQTFGVEHDLLQ